MKRKLLSFRDKYTDSNRNLYFERSNIMFTTSDKVVLGVCGLVTIAGILMIRSGLKGLKRLDEREKIERRLEVIKGEA